MCNAIFRNLAHPHPLSLASRNPDAELDPAHFGDGDSANYISCVQFSTNVTERERCTRTLSKLGQSLGCKAKTYNMDTRTLRLPP
jgi:hypothetical protein